MMRSHFLKYTIIIISVLGSVAFLFYKYQNNENAKQAVRQIVELYKLKDEQITGCKTASEKDVREMTLDGSKVFPNSVLLLQKAKLVNKSGQTEDVEWYVPISELNKPEVRQVLNAFNLYFSDLPTNSCDKWIEQIRSN